MSDLSLSHHRNIVLKLLYPFLMDQACFSGRHDFGVTGVLLDRHKFSLRCTFVLFAISK